MPENPAIPQNQPAGAPEHGPAKQFNGRLFLLKLGLAVFFVVIAVRLVQIQVIDSAAYREKARRQYEQKIVLPAVRGTMLDRNDNVIVSNSMLVSFAADPKVIANDAGVVAEKFSLVFGKPRSFYLSRMRAITSSGATRRFVWMERRVRPEVARRLESAKLRGVVVINEPKRLYHYDDVAGTLVGFTDVDNKGISGLELQFDEYLRGKDGSVIMQRDGLGRARPSVDYPRLEPRDGNDLTLTIDLAYQSIAEEELKRGIERYKADAGLAIMLNPKTGEILALANFPGLNPNDLGSYDINAARNRVITDSFEPGSVFKIVTGSAAYEHSLIAPGKRFNAEGGTYKVPLPGGRFRLIKDTHEHDMLTFQEAIEQSSNIVMAKASLVIGPERLYRQARNFGFGIPTGIDLPGEVRGRLKKPNEWSGTTLQTLSYGYEIAATPLQIAAAYAAVANGGVLMRPYVVARVTNTASDAIYEQRPQVIRTVVTPETAKLMTRAFEGVVENGSGKDVRINGVRIAGKTGTSRKVVDGKYGMGSYTASFVGFFPVENPQIVCLVMMDNPRAVSYYGGLTSAPIFRAIAERIINSTGRFPKSPKASEKQQPKQNGISVPDVRTLQVAIAGKILEGQGFKSETIGSGDVVVRQVPEPGKRLEEGDVVKLVLEGTEAAETAGPGIVPNVRGMSLRRAINRLVVDDFDIKVRGSGVVVQQIPAPGQRVNPGSTIQLVCEPRALVSAALY
ncbi:MAG: penicillin-binding transpeptidase domain-containing protein [Bacteroidota bacterium]